MKIRKVVSLLLLIAVMPLSLLLYGCKKAPTQYSAHSFDYFDTVTTISGYASSEEEFDRISEELLSMLGEYHRLYTIYQRFDGMENLCTVNELKDGVHRVVKVDRRIIDMLLYAKELYQKTNGKMNIAMGSVLSIWHDYREAASEDPVKAEVPAMEALLLAAEHTDIESIVIDEEESTVFLSDPKMKLDVGAVAKGYAVEMLARSLEERGISGYVINVGGNVRTVGTKGNGDPWIAGITNPIETEDEPYVAYLKLSGESIVTSGSYQRYYMVDGKSYHHIIDPETLMPAEGYLSVSVLCKSSADGDALSTALFCMPLEEGQELVRSLDGVEVLWILSDGTEIASEGFSAYLREN